MRKFLSILFCFIIFVTCTISVSALSDDIQLEDASTLKQGGFTECDFNFENPTDPTDRCIRLKRQDNPSNETETWIECFLSSKYGYKFKGKFSVEFKIYFDELINFSTFFYENYGQSVLGIYFKNDGTVSVGVHRVAKIEPKKWHKIEITLDTDRMESAIKINGMQLSSRIEPERMSFGLSSSGGIGIVRFEIDDSGQNGKFIYLDDIKINSLNGLASDCEVIDFNINHKSEPTKAIETQFSLRLNNRQKILLFGALYDKNGTMLNAVTRRYIMSSNGNCKLNVPVGEYANDNILKLFVWKNESLAPVCEKYIIPIKDACGEDFEIYPDTGEDITEKLQEALDVLPDGGTLTLKEGAYIISPQFATMYCLSITEKKNITIDGSNCEFIIDTPFAGFMRVGNSTNITIKNFTVDYREVPWGYGVVSSISDYSSEDDSGYFDIVSDSDIFKTETYRNKYISGFLTIRDTENVRIQKAVAGEHYWVSSFDTLDDKTYRFSVSDWSAQSMIKGRLLNVGDHVIFTGRGMGGAVFRIGDSDNIRISNVTAYASGECGITAANMKGDIVLDRFCLLIRGDRAISTNADGVHCQFSRGALKMYNCVFEGLSDDCVNLYQKPILVQKADDNKITVNNMSLICEGDTLTFFDWSNERILGKAKVIGLEQGVVILDSKISFSNSRCFAYINEGMFHGSEIINCRFADSRRYGLYLKCHNIRVEGCTFENLGADAIICEYLDSEGFNVENAEFVDNIFKKCGYIEYNGKTNSAIYISGSESEGNYIHKNISITGNTIQDTGGTGIIVKSVDGLVVENNTFTQMGDGIEFIDIKNCRPEE